jgi:DNA sulfur modification protein DndD
MKLKRLELRDFRQFQGVNELEFASEEAHNVTVVFGANGSGKTTLLNALTWVLYGQLSRDFLYQDQLINEQTWANANVGEPVTAQVRLIFEHEDQIHSLTRVVTAQKPSADSRQTGLSESIHLSTIDSSGRSREIKGAEDFVNSLLPKKLHHFFFLNGERFEHLHSDEAYQDIESAIKVLLGVEIMERALRHLPEVERKLMEEYSSIGGADVQAINSEIIRAENSMRAAHETVSEIEKEQEARQERIIAIEERLRELESAKDLQRRRDEARAAFDKADAEIDRSRDQLAREISDLGFLAFIQPLVAKTLSTYEDLRLKRELPKTFKSQFIDDLLENGTCICGSDLSEPGPCREAVLEWKNRAGMPGVDEAWQALCARAKAMPQDAARLAERLDSLDKTVTRARVAKTQAEEELSAVSTQLESAAEDDIATLETKRQTLEREQRRDSERIGAYRKEITDSEQLIAAWKRDRDRAVADNRKAATAKRRVEAVEEVQDLLNDLRSIRIDEVRRELNSKIKETFERIIYQDYSTTLTDHFRLVLQKTVDGRRIPVARSTGQGQILVLAFVGALAAMARERATTRARTAAQMLNLPAGGVFPFVSDAVFGTLEDTYRREIASALPELAPQVVIFVSKAQGLGVVESELRTRVGHEYVIQVQTPKASAQPETIELAGRSLPYVDIRPHEPERSRLVAVRGDEDE